MEHTNITRIYSIVTVDHDRLARCIFRGDYDTIEYGNSLTLCIACKRGRYTFNRIYAFLTQNDEGDKYLTVYDIVNSPVSLNGIVESNLEIRTNVYTAQIGIP